MTELNVVITNLEDQNRELLMNKNVDQTLKGIVKKSTELEILEEKMRNVQKKIDKIRNEEVEEAKISKENEEKQIS